MGYPCPNCLALNAFLVYYSTKLYKGGGKSGNAEKKTLFFKGGLLHIHNDRIKVEPVRFLDSFTIILSISISIRSFEKVLMLTFGISDHTYCRLLKKEVEKKELKDIYKFPCFSLI